MPGEKPALENFKQNNIKPAAPHNLKAFDSQVGPSAPHCPPWTQSNLRLRKIDRRETGICRHMPHARPLAYLGGGFLVGNHYDV